MNFSAPFIARPVATTLLTIGLALAGRVGVFPVAGFAAAERRFPTISVTAQMPGASPETMATSVATPLERHLGTIADVTEMTSSSSVGSTRVVLQFGFEPRHRRRRARRAGRDQCRARRSAGCAAIQPDLSQSQSRRSADSDFGADLRHADAGTDLRLRVHDPAAEAVSQVAGIGTGADRRQFAARRSRAISIRARCSNMASASRTCARHFRPPTPIPPKAPSKRRASAIRFMSTTQAIRADQYRSLIVAYRNSAAVRLSDIADVNDGVEDVRNLGMANGKPAMLVISVPPARRQHYRRGRPHQARGAAVAGVDAAFDHHYPVQRSHNDDPPFAARCRAARC